MNRDNALDFTPAEISMWSSTTQSIAWFAALHFNLFNEIESGKMNKRTIIKARKALGTLYRAAAYLRATANETAEAFDPKFFVVK